MKKIFSVFVTILLTVLSVITAAPVYAASAASQIMKYVCVQKVVNEENSDGTYKQTTYKYSYDANGNIIQYISSSEETFDICQQIKTVYTYDKKGKNTKSVTEITNNSGVVSTTTSIMTYDKKGNLTNKETVQLAGKKKTATQTECTYDSSGNNLTKNYKYEKNGDVLSTKNIKKTYDSFGRLTVKTEGNTDDDGSNKKTTTYKYDSDGNVIYEGYTVKYSRGSNTVINTTNTYKNGKLTKKATQESHRDGSKSSSTQVYTYDKNGRVSVIKSTEKSDEYESEMTDKYTYNSKGVAVKEVIEQKSNNDFTETRTITKNDNGDLLKDYSKIQNYIGSISYNQTVCKYDTDGNLLSNIITYTSSDGDEEKYSEVYTYDSNGRVKTLQKGEYYNKKAYRTEKTEYTYDKNGNKTKSVYTYSDTDSKKKITETYKYAACKQKNALMYETENFSVKYSGSCISDEQPAIKVYYNDDYYGCCSYFQGYDYTVKYINTGKSSKSQIIIQFIDDYEYFGSVTLNYKVIPAQVKNLKAAKIAKDYITLKWSKVTCAAYYRVEKSADGKTWSTVKTVSSDNLKVTGLSGGTKYYFRVIALDSLKKLAGQSSKTLCAVTLTASPVLTVKSEKSKMASLTWKKVGKATGYVIYQSSDGKKWTNTVDTEKTSYTVKNLTGGKTVYFKVTAKNSAGKESASDVKSVIIKK